MKQEMIFNSRVYTTQLFIKASLLTKKTKVKFINKKYFFNIICLIQILNTIYKKKTSILI